MTSTGISCIRAAKNWGFMVNRRLLLMFPDKGAPIARHPKHFLATRAGKALS